MGLTLTSIFVVDDEQIIAETLTTILQKSGFAAKPFTDPREALAAARAETPDLLLSDVMMPELSGVDLAIAIRKECPKCRIMLFSGHAETADLLLSARERGCDFELLSKPLHPTDLLRHIRQDVPVGFLEHCTVKMIDPERYFIHQWNPNRTIDSVCSVCNSTVCTESSLARVQECEEKHECPSWAADRFNGGLGHPVSRSG